MNAYQDIYNMNDLFLIKILLLYVCIMFIALLIRVIVIRTVLKKINNENEEHKDEDTWDVLNEENKEKK